MNENQPPKKNSSTNHLEIEKEKIEDPPLVAFRKLFTYADSTDILLITIGSLAAIIDGGGFPVVFVIFGGIAESFITFGTYLQCDLNYTICVAQNFTNLNRSEWDQQVAPSINYFEQSSDDFALYFIYCAVGIFILGTIHIACWSLQAARQTARIKSAYFKAVLRQDITFHEATSAGELSSRLAHDIEIIQLGISGKVSLTIQYFCKAIAGVILGFISSWQLTLVSLAIAPMLGISSVLIIMLLGLNVKKELQAYADGGAVADEAISSIRTVVSLGCQQKFVDRYVEKIQKAKPVAIKGGFINGFSYGLFDCALFGMIGLAFWYGATLILSGALTVASFFSFFGILIGTFALGTGLANFETFTAARAAGAKVFEVIDRKPKIDAFSDEGEDPENGSVDIVFEDVDFSYPCRSDVQVLQGLSLNIKKEQTVALVGGSGCGKSTIIQLIQRFYDCQKGNVRIGGKNLKSLNVKKHRDQIGVVSQEPVLFATTIAENIRWGRDGVTDEEIHEAAKQANAYDFIMRFPDKFETLVGEGGGQMSGGQKQRIAIARAIVRNPKILLLDEATSALDTESESIVQAALDKVAAGRTTVIVAHRLSTVRNADKIIVIESGKAVEEGSHDELLGIDGGKYNNLIKIQLSQTDEGEDDVNKEIEDDVKKTIQKRNTKPRFRKQSTWLKSFQKRSKFQKTVDFGRRSASSMATLRRNDQKKTIYKRSSRLRSFRLEDTNMISPLASPRPSMTSVVESLDYRTDADEEDEEELADVSFLDLLKLNKQEWIYIFFGCIFAGCGGTAIPFFSILFADLLSVFSRSNSDNQLYYATLYSLLIFVVGIGLFVFFILEAACFAKSGIELVLRVRRKAFQSILRQDISFFDQPANNSAALSNKLSLDASRLQGATGPRLGILVKAATTIGFSLVIAFYYTWKLSLAILAFIPLQALGSFFESKVIKDSENPMTESEMRRGNIAIEAIRNIHTVASLCMEKILYEQYTSTVTKPIRKLLLRSLVRGVAYSLGQCVIYFAYAVTFRLGAFLVLNGEISFDNVFKVLVALMFGAVITGQNISIAPNYAEAKLSASRLFTLFEREPMINADNDEGLTPAHCKGDIKVKSVFFAYPTNPGFPILRRANLKINQGKTLALVGQSGCGKSSLIRLLERFYDPQRGVIELDGIDTRKLNVSWFRQQIGLVSQEPILFQMSIGENIRYGDCSRKSSEEEVVEAAKRANIHEFIESLPQKYATDVGARGSQLSGGQKQRIAIARALLRNPKILLLDEATSALDAESEKVVLSSLNDAKEGRTTIAIAHRLSTVKNADVIAVVENGIIVESGTHKELLDRKGPYFSLWSSQQG